MNDLDELIREQVEYTRYDGSSCASALDAVLDLNPPEPPSGIDPAVEAALIDGWVSCMHAVKLTIARELGVDDAD